MSAIVFMHDYFNPIRMSDLEDRTLQNADELEKLTRT